MNAFTPVRVLAMLLAFFMLAACATQPVDEDEADVDRPEVPDAAEVDPVEDDERVRPEEEAPDDPDRFHNHPANYDGSTDTRVIYFAFDRSEIPSAAFDALRAHARYLQDNSDAQVRLEGHTDERGTREYNIGLGERRAQSVEQFLRVQGVPANQLETVSYGEEKPAEQGSDEMAWAQNRRVELNYTSREP